MLSSAVFFADFTFVEFLIQFPGILYHRLESGLSEGEVALSAAFEKNEIHILKLLLAKNISPKNVPGMKIGESRYNEVSKLVLEYGASIEQTIEEFDMCLLHYAIVHCNDNMTRYLIDKGAKVQVVDKYGFEPIHDAVWTRNVPVIELLVKQGCDVNARLPRQRLRYYLDGSTPLHLAVRAEHKQSVRALLLAGAHVAYPCGAVVLP